MQAQQTAGRLGKPEISSLDVLVALLEQEGGILSPILRKASCDPGLLLQAAQREVSHEPTQSGATTQPQMGRDLATVMQAAEEERKSSKTTTSAWNTSCLGRWTRKQSAPVDGHLWADQG